MRSFGDIKSHSKNLIIYFEIFFINDFVFSFKKNCQKTQTNNNKIKLHHVISITKKHISI